MHDIEPHAFYTARNVDAVYDVDSRVGVLLAAAQHKGKGEVRGKAGEEEGVLGHRTGARTRSKQEASARGTAQKSLLGRWLHRQSKGEPLVQNQNKKRHGQMASTAARSTAKKVVRAVPALQHACCPWQMCTCAPTTVRTGSTQPGGAKSLQHTETKKGFFHAFLLLLQAAATSFKHEGFAAIRTPRTGSA